MVEAAFRAGADPAMQTCSIVLPRPARPKAWPELDEEQCHRLVRRVLEPAVPLHLIVAWESSAFPDAFVSCCTIPIRRRT